MITKPAIVRSLYHLAFAGLEIFSWSYLTLTNIARTVSRLRCYPIPRSRLDLPRTRNTGCLFSNALSLFPSWSFDRDATEFVPLEAPGAREEENMCGRIWSIAIAASYEFPSRFWFKPWLDRRSNSGRIFVRIKATRRVRGLILSSEDSECRPMAAEWGGMGRYSSSTN